MNGTYQYNTTVKNTFTENLCMPNHYFVFVLMYVIQGVPYGGLSFPGISVTYRMLAILTLFEVIKALDIIFLFTYFLIFLLISQRCFRPWIFF